MLKHQDSISGDPQWSLLTDPWIPVTQRDGTNKEVSVLQALLDGQNISSITCDFPQGQFPIYRLLLAFLYRAYSEALGAQQPDEISLEDEWRRIWSQGQFDEDIIRSYAKQTEGGWYLLDLHRPFYQIPGLEYGTDKDYDPISSVLPDMPGKHEKFLFSMRAENSVSSIPYDAAARLLVYLQGYDISGIHTPVKGSTTARHGKEYPPHGMMGTGLLGALGGVYAQGFNLFETLMLNWVLVTDHKPLLVGADAPGHIDDFAPWDPDYCIPSPLMDTDHQASGVVGELTWQSRRMLLIPTEDRSSIKGIRICFGDIPQVLNSNDLEMMTVWRYSAVQAKRHHISFPQLALMPNQHDPAKYEWQGLASLLTSRPVKVKKTINGNSQEIPKPGIITWIDSIRDYIKDHPLSSEAHGVPDIVTLHAEGIEYGSQSAVVSSGIDDELELDSTLFGEKGVNRAYVNGVIGCVDQSEQSVYELTRFVHNLQVVAGSKNPDNEIEEVEETAYHELDRIFRRRLRSMPGPDDMDEFLQGWRDEVHRLILALADSYRRRNQAPLFAFRTEKNGSKNDTIMSSSLAEFYLRNALNQTLGKLTDFKPHRPSQNQNYLSGAVKAMTLRQTTAIEQKVRWNDGADCNKAITRRCTHSTESICQ